MKLEIRWREMTPSADLLAYVKEGIAAWARPHPWTTRLRVLLSTDGGDFARCRIEVGLRGGVVRVIEAASDDLFFAIDAAIERLTVVVDGHERAAHLRAA